MFGIFKQLFAGSHGGPRTAQAEPFDYQGFTVLPTPLEEDGGWRVAGLITRGDKPNREEHRFIRADVIPTAQQAIEITAAKARRLIDEQGDRIFSLRPE